MKTRNKRSAQGFKGHPQFCNRIDCFVQEEYRKEMGVTQWVTVLHCKTLKEVENKSMTSSLTTPKLCDGCNVREGHEHRCHGENCQCDFAMCKSIQK